MDGNHDCGGRHHRDAYPPAFLGMPRPSVCAVRALCCIHGINWNRCTQHYSIHCSRRTPNNSFRISFPHTRLPLGWCIGRTFMPSTTACAVRTAGTHSPITSSHQRISDAGAYSHLMQWRYVAFDDTLSCVNCFHRMASVKAYAFRMHIRESKCVCEYS